MISEIRGCRTVRGDGKPAVRFAFDASEEGMDEVRRQEGPCNRSFLIQNQQCGGIYDEPSCEMPSLWPHGASRTASRHGIGGQVPEMQRAFHISEELIEKRKEFVSHKSAIPIPDAESGTGKAPGTLVVDADAREPLATS